MGLVWFGKGKVPNKKNDKRKKAGVDQEPGYRYMLDFGMRVLNSSIIQSEHAMKWFGKDEQLKAYPDWKYYGKTNIISSIGLLRIDQLGTV